MMSKLPEPRQPAELLTPEQYKESADRLGALIDQAKARAFEDRLKADLRDQGLEYLVDSSPKASPPALLAPPSRSRRAIGTALAISLIVLGLSAILFWLGGQSRGPFLMAGIVMLCAGIFWIKEDWFGRD